VSSVESVKNSIKASTSRKDSGNHLDNFTMPQVFNYLAIAALAACAVATPVAEPAITAAPSLEKRATCTFSGSKGAASASASQKSCATIVLSNVAVPSGVALDLSNLNDGTHVRSHDTPVFPLFELELIVFALGHL
jgi:hypothetical protein